MENKRNTQNNSSSKVEDLNYYEEGDDYYYEEETSNQQQNDITDYKYDPKHFQHDEDHHQYDHHHQQEQIPEVADNDKEMKEALVRKEILEKGYAPQDFEYYLQKIKAGSQDLNKWGMSELRNVILEFQDHQLAQMLQNEEKQTRGGGYLREEAKVRQNPNLDPKGRPMIPNDKIQKIMPFLRPYEHGPYLEVNKLKPTILNKNINIFKFKVCNPKVQQQTEFLFIKSNQLIVQIQTNPVKWDVVRSESDIYLLRRLLQMQFPHLLIPPLPSKTEYKFQPKSMQHRCVRLNRFFSAVCRNEELCTYQILVDFLMIRHKDAKTFTDRMKQEEQALTKARISLKPDIHELSSMYDKVYTKLLPEAVSFDLPQFTDRFEALCRGCIEDSRDVNEKSNQLHLSYLKLQDVLMRLSQFHQDDSLDTLEAYAHSSKVFGTDAFIIQQQGEQILKAFKYLKYNIEFVNTMRDMQWKSEHAKQRFLKAEKTFLTKREKVVGQLGQQNQQKVSQTVIDSLLPVEAKELEKSTQFMNYFTNQIYQEVRRMQSQMEYEGLQENFKQLTKDYTTGLNQRNISWSGLLQTLSKGAVANNK